MQVESGLDEFLDYLKDQVEYFIVHDFKVEKQLQFVCKTKQELQPEPTNREDKPVTVLIQCDFAENYTCTLQDSIQATYFSAPQITVHTACIFYNTRVIDEDNNDKIVAKCINTIGVSSVVQHNSAMVYAVQTKLVDLVKHKFKNVGKISYLSDGCAGQYKNKTNFKNLCLHQDDFDIVADWHFFPTSHGKGPVDGIRGTFKRAASRASQRGARIYSSKELYDWAIQAKESGHAWQDFLFYEITEQEVNAANEEIAKRIPGLVAVPGTKSYHSFIPHDHSTIEVRDYSFQPCAKVVSLSKINSSNNNDNNNCTNKSCNKKRKAQ